MGVALMGTRNATDILPVIVAKDRGTSWKPVSLLNEFETPVTESVRE
ncbi:hypothetical protein RISK_002160 [Rhodopirellula islandica]|uniref:Uncharacterized protein n=1 Tax=Rhodopirellula islandica TaxID=595434 RepID=A0A0J1BG66_RHOIS|nr:hypothetical protein RISK_002160 [Rhodopirellula islandica]